MLPSTLQKMLVAGRSREGAWIEIALFALLLVRPLRRSREGAWIEIAPLMRKALIVGTSLP